MALPRENEIWDAAVKLLFEVLSDNILCEFVDSTLVPITVSKNEKNPSCYLKKLLASYRMKQLYLYLDRKAEKKFSNLNVKYQQEEADGMTRACGVPMQTLFKEMGGSNNFDPLRIFDISFAHIPESKWEYDRKVFNLHDLEEWFISRTFTTLLMYNPSTFPGEQLFTKECDLPPYSPATPSSSAPQSPDYEITSPSYYPPSYEQLQLGYGSLSQEYEEL